MATALDTPAPRPHDAPFRPVCCGHETAVAEYWCRLTGRATLLYRCETCRRLYRVEVPSWTCT